MTDRKLMTDLPLNTWNVYDDICLSGLYRALACTVYWPVGLSPEMGLKHLRLFDETNAIASGVSLTMKSYFSYWFLAAFDLGSHAVVTLKSCLYLVLRIWKIKTIAAGVCFFASSNLGALTFVRIFVLYLCIRLRPARGYWPFFLISFSHFTVRLHQAAFVNGFVHVLCDVPGTLPYELWPGM